jgi:hypothetical protein
MQGYPHHTGPVNIRVVSSLRGAPTLTRFWRHRRHAERTFLGGAAAPVFSSGAIVCVQSRAFPVLKAPEYIAMHYQT